MTSSTSCDNAITLTRYVDPGDGGYDLTLVSVS